MEASVPCTEPVSSLGGTGLEAGRATTGARVRGWRSARLQVVIVGLLAFCGPGLFNALSALGHAGTDDPTVAAVANGTLYLVFAVSSYFAGAAFNIFGPLPLFVFGGSTYAAYAVCVYFSSEYGFLAAVGGAVLGVGAGLFWTAQGTLMIAYATPETRGRFIGLFWVMFNLGGVCGGLIQFALNFDNEDGSVSPWSYFSFIAAMLGGALLAPGVLARPSQVVREDGSSVTFPRAESPGAELAAAAAAFEDPFVLKCLFFFFTSNWFYTYDFNGLNGTQFNVRTRGLNSALFWLAQMVAAVAFGWVLDSSGSPSTRAARGMSLVVMVMVMAQGPAILLNFFGLCGGEGVGWDKDAPCDLDLADDFPYSLVPMTVLTLNGVADAIYQNFAYWLMSMAAGSDTAKVVQYAAVYKGTQSLGAGLAWLLDLNAGYSYRAQGIVALAINLAACLPVVRTFQGLGEDRSSSKAAGDVLATA